MRNTISGLAGAAVVTAALALGSTRARAADIAGAGASFPYPVYTKWADAYRKETGTGLNYQSIGSGGGIKQIKAKTVTFGATDAPLSGKDLDESGLAQFPMVMGGIVPVVNVEGLQPSDLVLDGATSAKIFLGEVKTWNDPAIAKLNANVKLPNQAIAIVHRSDGSGTTSNFTYYLSEVSADWKTKVGTNTAVEWPGGLGAKGNEGVANNVAQTKGSIGYVEYAYAKRTSSSTPRWSTRTARLLHRPPRPSRPRSPTPIGTPSPATASSWPAQPGATSWPMTAATWILLYKTPQDPAATAEALKFFAWSFAKGDKMAEELDYVPMPDKVVGDIEKMWSTEIKDAAGKSLYVASK
jgi:phosphate transport system substrate-binding protein